MLQKVFIENFKAIHTGTDLPIQPFTVFIGNNGTGKSSIIEALWALQIAVNSDLDRAFKEWGGLERVRNYNAYLSEKKSYDPLTIALTALVNEKLYEYKVQINLEDGYYVVENEELKCDNELVFTFNRHQDNNKIEVYYYPKGEKNPSPFFHDGRSLILSFKGSPSFYFKGLDEFSRYILNWQFLYLNAHNMGIPNDEDKLNRVKKLDREGRNIAEYLLWMKEQGEEHLDSLISKMRFVLPYIDKIEPHIIKETINTQIELLLYETGGKDKSIPGWLLSSGTLRILALLAIFESPNRPSVLFIDEIENGLDPRTIGLLLSQVESVFAEKSMQVIVTTHSPFFLDMVPLESIIVSEKVKEGSVYEIPENKSNLNAWKDKFSPGKLYTMGKLTK
ncbi:MAG: AAA family ATPase [Bacteroidetes bacterium]|nr:AAA family ATPase [Bacteroidota bacterium]